MAEVPSGMDLLNRVREVEGLPPLDLDPNNPEDIAALQEEWRRQNANASTMSRLEFIRFLATGKRDMPKVSETEQAKFAQRDEEARKKWLLEALSEMLGAAQTGRVGSDEELTREAAMSQGLRMLNQGSLVSDVERILREAGVDPVAANPELHRSYGLAVAGDPQTPQADPSSLLGQAQRLGPLGGPGIGEQPANKAGRIPSSTDAVLQLARLLREGNRGII